MPKEDLVTVTARVPRKLRDKLERYRRKNGLRSLNEALRKILEDLKI